MEKSNSESVRSMYVKIGNTMFALDEEDIETMIKAMKKKLSNDEALEEFYEAFIDRWNFTYGFLGLIIPEGSDLEDMASLIAIINHVLKLNKCSFDSIGEALEFINEHIEKAINRILDYKLTKKQTKMYKQITDYLKKGEKW